MVSLIDKTSSRIPGLYKMSVPRRLEVISQASGFTAQEKAVLNGTNGGGLPLETADRMVENCVGVFSLPMGIGVNMRIDAQDRLVPMAVEEPSVIAGLSHGAKLLRTDRGIETQTTAPLMIGQIQVLDILDIESAKRAIRENKQMLLEKANALDPVLVECGGGAQDLEIRVLEPHGANDPLGTMLVLHLIVDVRDAMGANAINTMAENLAPTIETLTSGRVRLRILSNLADRRLVTAKGKVPFDRLGGGDTCKGEQIARGIEEASVLAERDPYRAATHNKGIMNGIDALLVATGQDWRAVEAGAHAYAARQGRYTALSNWRVDTQTKTLTATLTLPMAVGTVGGVLKTHPTVQVGVRRVLKISNASDLARVAAACGLAQNLAALRALATEGIQRGHMTLHARNMASTAGACGDEIDKVAALLAARRSFDAASAAAALADVRRSAKT
jgi:hydroxymethylglutaryl-CoA reductase